MRERPRLSDTGGAIVVSAMSLSVDPDPMTWVDITMEEDGSLGGEGFFDSAEFAILRVGIAVRRRFKCGVSDGLADWVGSGDKSA